MIIKSLLVVKLCYSIEVLHNYVVRDLHRLNRGVGGRTYSFDSNHALFIFTLRLYKEIGVAAMLSLDQHQVGVPLDLSFGHMLDLADFVVLCDNDHAWTLNVANKAITMDS